MEKCKQTKKQTETIKSSLKTCVTNQNPKTQVGENSRIPSKEEGNEKLPAGENAKLPKCSGGVGFSLNGEAGFADRSFQCWRG